MSITRRTLLSALPALVFAPRLARAQRPGRSAIVVGAGASGLAAANRLHTAGVRVTVIEARDRLGGRIWTDRSLGIPIDLGAAWIEGDRGPAMRLARQFGLATDVSDWTDEDLIDAAGRLVSDIRTARATRMWQTVMRTIQRRASTVDRDEPLAIALRAGLARVRPSDRALVSHIAVTEIDEDLGESPERLSLTAFEQEEAFDGEDRVLPGGYVGLIDGLARGLDLRTGHTVQRVIREARGVRVECDRGSFTADQCVVTLPLALLRAGRVTFDPPLPASHRAVIEALGVGLLEKVALRFDRPFWPRERHFFGRVPPTPDGLRTWLNAWRWSDAPVLVGIIGADAARGLARRSEAEVIALAMESLRAMFGASVPDPARTIITRWNADPFSLGAYSCVPVGASHTMRERLAEPVDGALHLAGEATHAQYPATVHGALLSGWRAADRALGA